MLPVAQPIISLLTDFGRRDPYVGVLHAVIARFAPQARVIDLSHDVAPQDVEEAAFVLRAAVPYFPSNTVFVCVVDPGVGSERRILCARTAEGQTFLAPDNGLLGHVLDPAGPQPRGLAGREARWRSVENRALFLSAVSHTFHGRDIFAPVAARLAAGLDPAEVGPEVSDPAPARGAAFRELGAGVNAGEVAHVDHFGNLITNLYTGRHGPRVARAATLGRVIDGPVCTSYAQRPEGAPLLITSSTGLLEVAVRGGSARDRLGARRSDPVEVTVTPE